MHSDWLSVVLWIIEAARMKAQSIERFRTSRQGCVRVCAYAMCKEADDWFGGLGTFNKNVKDVADYDYVKPIVAGGSPVAVFEEDGRKVYVNTYGITAMKIADCSRSQHMDLPAISGIPHEARQPDDSECGYAKWAGALCVEVEKRDSEGEWSDFCGIYVSVSGANENEDLECAKFATSVIADFFAAEGDNYRINIPDTSAL